MKNNSFLPLYVTNFFGTLNDNFSPSFVPTFVKSVSLWFLWAPFVPRRRVTMHVEDMTDRIKEWSKLSRLEFNRKLEEWYNV